MRLSLQIAAWGCLLLTMSIQAKPAISIPEFTMPGEGWVSLHQPVNSYFNEYFGSMDHLPGKSRIITDKALLEGLSRLSGEGRAAIWRYANDAEQKPCYFQCQATQLSGIKKREAFPFNASDSFLYRNKIEFVLPGSVYDFQFFTFPGQLYPMKERGLFSQANSKSGDLIILVGFNLIATDNNGRESLINDSPFVVFLNLGQWQQIANQSTEATAYLSGRKNSKFWFIKYDKFKQRG